MPAFASIETRPSPSPGVRPRSASTAIGRGLPRPTNLLPNIQVLGIQYREGPDPGVARFRYVFDAANPVDRPDLLPGGAVDRFRPARRRPGTTTGSWSSRYNPDGSPIALFDGFAQVPELSLSPSRGAGHVPRLRGGDPRVGHADRRRPDARRRRADDGVRRRDRPRDPLQPRGGDPTRPRTGPTPGTLGKHLSRPSSTRSVVRDPDLRRLWTLSMAVRYLCYHNNPDETYVQNPDGDLIDALLDSRAPQGRRVCSSRATPPPTTASRSSSPITRRPASPGRALHDLLEPNGFGMVFRLETDATATRHRRWTSSVARTASTRTRTSTSRPRIAARPRPRRTSGRPTSPGTQPGWPTRTRSSRGWSATRRRSSWRPGFPIAADDAADASSLGLRRATTSISRGTNHDHYRLYIFDETGEGHWDFASAAMVDDVALAGGPARGRRARTTAPFVRRRRRRSASSSRPTRTRSP